MILFFSIYLFIHIIYSYISSLVVTKKCHEVVVVSWLHMIKLWFLILYNTHFKLDVKVNYVKWNRIWLSSQITLSWTSLIGLLMFNFFLFLICCLLFYFFGKYITWFWEFLKLCFYTPKKMNNVSSYNLSSIIFYFIC